MDHFDRYCVYMMSNPRNTVLYTGVTNNLPRRVLEHQQRMVQGFTAKYNCCKLVYFEQTSDINEAIEREKEIKGWIRAKKNMLVETLNPVWKDLADEIFG